MRACAYLNLAQPRATVPSDPETRCQTLTVRLAILQSGPISTEWRPGLPNEAKSMKAAVLHRFGDPLALEEVELRGPGSDEVLVRIAACGVCQSDLHIIRGEWKGFDPPLIAGHEGAGVVESVGDAVTHVRSGDHVVVGWKSSCGACRQCIEARPHLCTSPPRPLPSSSISRGGELINRSFIFAYFAEYAVVPKSVVIRVPEAIPHGRAALLACAVATGVGAAVNTAQVRPGATVAVFGCGGVGLNVIQGARLCGASRIIGIDISQGKLAYAQPFGVTDTVNAADGDAVDAVLALTGGFGADYAFEAAGSSRVIEQAMAATAHGGTCVIAGMPGFRGEVDLALPLMPFFGDRWLTASYYGGTNLRRDIPMLADLYLRGKLELDALVTRTYALEDINRAFADLVSGKPGRGVVLI